MNKIFACVLCLSVILYTAPAFANWHAFIWGPQSSHIEQVLIANDIAVYTPALIQEACEARCTLDSLNAIQTQIQAQNLPINLIIQPESNSINQRVVKLRALDPNSGRLISTIELIPEQAYPLALREATSLLVQSIQQQSRQFIWLVSLQGFDDQELAQFSNIVLNQPGRATYRLRQQNKQSDRHFGVTVFDASFDVFTDFPANLMYQQILRYFSQVGVSINANIDSQTKDITIQRRYSPLWSQIADFAIVLGIIIVVAIAIFIGQHYRRQAQQRALKQQSTDMHARSVKYLVAQAVNANSQGELQLASQYAHQALSYCHEDKLQQRETLRRLIDNIEQQYKAREATTCQLLAIQMPNKKHFVYTQDCLLVGRQNGANTNYFQGLDLRHPAVSRHGQQIALTVTNEQLSVSDQGSTNGTFISTDQGKTCERLRPSKACKLFANTLIRIGATKQTDAVCELLVTNSSNRESPSVYLTCINDKQNWLQLPNLDSVYWLYRAPLFISLKGNDCRLLATQDKYSLAKIYIQQAFFIEELGHSKLALNGKPFIGRLPLGASDTLTVDDISIQLNLQMLTQEQGHLLS